MALKPSALAAGLLALLLLPLSVAAAGRIDHVNVDLNDGRYSVFVSAWLALPQAELKALLTDYEKAAKSNASIVSVEILPSEDEAVTRLKAKLKVCVAFFCRRLTQVQDMTLVSNGFLQAQMLPELSDYRYGYASWRMIAEGEGSRLLFVVEVEPDFWVPPLIGPLLIKQKLRQEAVETVIGLEALAAEDEY